MKKTHLVWAIALSLGLVLGLTGTVRAGQRPLYVCINGDGGDLLSARGKVLQSPEYEDGQALVGPIPPGEYILRTEEGDVAFTLCTNASVCRVSGPGWTDGEQLHLGQGMGQLTVLYDDSWACTLSGETAAKTLPSMAEGVCIFHALPLGCYTLHTPIGDIPILLTPEEQAITVDLRA